VLGRLRLRDLLISRRSGVTGFSRPPSYFGCSESQPVVKLWITSLTRSVLVNDTSATIATGTPSADRRTLWAHRRVTTDLVPVWMIRSRRCPCHRGCVDPGLRRSRRPIAVNGPIGVRFPMARRGRQAAVSVEVPGQEPRRVPPRAPGR
jgi:hypothetical protein